MDMNTPAFAGPHGPAGAPLPQDPLRRGARVGSYKVTTSDPTRLVLEGSGKRALGVIALGLVCTLWGAMAWAAFFRDDPSPSRDEPRYYRGDAPRSDANRVSGKALMIAPIGLLIIFVGAATWGSGCIADGATGRLRLTGWFGGRALDRDAMGGVLLRLLPTNLNQRESVELILQDTVGRPLLHLGRRRSTRADAINLACAARRLAELLRLPLTVEGEPLQGGTRELREAVEHAGSGRTAPGFLPRYAA
jgi:hypothetical protein